MKTKLTAITVFTLLAAGAAHVQGRDDDPCSSGAVISDMTEISNDIHVQGYGLTLGFMPFSLESSTIVDSTQSSNNNPVGLRHGSDTATVGRQALKGAQGAVGMNVASSAGNVQSSGVALAAVDVGEVFTSAQVFNSQVNPGESLSVGSTLNKVSLDGGTLNGTKGTIGVNTATGAGELQEDGMAASTNTSGRIAKTTDYNEQSTDDNSLRLNGCDPTNVALLNGTALMNAMGNIGANIATGTGNLQHNGLTIATAKAAN